MKKLDLHIHTVSTYCENTFLYSIKTLKDYVETMNLDCIAITNHNIFDMQQFNDIAKELSILVLPGIEVDIENGHILLIADNDKLHEFNEKCSCIQSYIRNKNDSLTLEQFQNIFIDFSKYLLIPHYRKEPEINPDVLCKLSKYISAGEVNSVKKFFYCVKDEDSLTPVLFSDLRIKDGVSNFPTRQTYFDLDEINLNSIKFCLQDKSKVSLSKKEGHRLFQVLNNGLEISSGVNVILGERSSGKSYTMDSIYTTQNNIKYIKQFSLLEPEEKDAEENFNKLLSVQQSSVADTYLKEFRSVIDDIKDIDISVSERKIEKYLKSLIKYASDIEKADSFSKARLFNECDFTITNLNSLKTLIDSVRTLISNTEYKTFINRFISEKALVQLLTELIKEHNKKLERNLKKTWVNDLVRNIKNDLQLRTATTKIEDIDLYKILMERRKVKKFIEITELIKTEREIERKELQGFIIVANVCKYTGSSELQKATTSKYKFSEAFDLYNVPYEYLSKLKDIELLKESDYYKCFVKIEYSILNKHGYKVSGGERSEFRLLQAINDALQYDMLLIDEPESSFDNLFLKNNVNNLIKRIAQNIPVVLITHNNTVGASIKPDYIIYTQKKVVGDNLEYYVYTGYPSDKELRSLNGESIKNFDILLNCLEAGKTAYEERGKSYEILEGREQ